MKLHHLIRELREENQTKIVLLVADGLGGLPLEANGKTELESARTPYLDACAREGVCGLSLPVQKIPVPHARRQKGGLAIGMPYREDMVRTRPFASADRALLTSAAASSNAAGIAPLSCTRRTC